MTAPTVTAKPVPVVSLSGKVGVSYAGTDNHRVSSYDVRYRKAPYNGAYTAMVYPTSWHAIAATSASMAATAGSTYCLSVRSRDAAGNVSAWSPERCTATPVDDRSLTASAKWVRSTGSAFFNHTVSTTATKGATLTHTKVRARRLVLLATTCPTCGSVGIYWNGALLKNVSLRSATTKNRQLMSITSFASVRVGTLVVKVRSAAPVKIDGVGVVQA